MPENAYDDFTCTYKSSKRVTALNYILKKTRYIYYTYTERLQSDKYRPEQSNQRINEAQQT